MAAVLDTSSDPEAPLSSQDGTLSPTAGTSTALGAAITPLQAVPSPVVDSSSGTGLKPIARLTSDSRIAKIIPESDARTVLRYSSQFARDFIRSDYNFCAAKMAVARKGKVRALDSALRETSEWLSKAIAWVEKHNARELRMEYEEIELLITRPLAGSLVRCLTQYDRLWVRTLEAQLARKFATDDAREIALANAEKRIRHICHVCIPDNDQYAADGSRIDG
ncbi:DUF1845 domain-containing protein [Paraburkholderia sediminicola]|uniref:DUF1845 domain-containing protein n=1 Tax=Paraburkholderia sediminicola TaxID=458836 RepID=UPI0038BBE21E